MKGSKFNLGLGLDMKRTMPKVDPGLQGLRTPR